MFECVKHGEVEKTESGYCVECCAEDHICELCGVWSVQRVNVEWRSASYFGDGRMLCDSCVVCEDCGDGDAEENSDYDAFLCSDCTEERDREWEEEEQSTAATV